MGENLIASLFQMEDEKSKQLPQTANYLPGFIGNKSNYMVLVM